MDKKIALITGASKGLGKEMALRLAKNGVNVLFTYHTDERTAKLVEREIEDIGARAKAFQYDASQPEKLDFFCERITNYLKHEWQEEKIDYLINNAGTGLFNTIENTTPSDFDQLINIHLKSVYFLTQKFLPNLNDGGRIINISSGLTRFSFPGASAYAIMKGGVEVFTRYLAKELGTKKITANVIAPGAIATDFGGGTNRDDETKRKVITNLTALGRIGEAFDIGGVVAFLCHEDAGWINGQRIEVSGGMLV